MTQEKEESMISDVAEMKGMLNRFLIEWDGRKDAIASKIDLACVDKKIDEHIADGKHRSGAIGAWIASGAAVVLAVVAILGIKA
jgi:hypothetical protein